MNKKRAIFTILALLTAGMLSSTRAQQTIIMTSGTQTFDLCQTGGSGIIYDNGGPEGDYSNSFDGTVVLQAQPGIDITLTGNYITESGYDYLYVYDGATTSAPLLGTFDGSGTLNVTASSGALMVRFYTDGSSTRSGFALSYTTAITTGCTNPVTNLTVSGVTSTTAQLGWSGSSDGTYAVTLVSSLGTQSLTTTTASCSLTGLHPGTQYQVRVIDTRDDGSPCCQVCDTFRTECAPTALPVYESFDGYGQGDANAFPTCWVRVKNYDNSSYPYIESYSGDPALRMYSGTLDYHYSIALLPELEAGVDLSQCFLRFRVYPESYNARLVVGVCQDTSLMTLGFTPVDTIEFGSSYGTWNDCIVSLASYSGTGRYVALRFEGVMQNYYNSYMRIDNVSLATCGLDQLSLSHLTHESVQLNFTTIGTPTLDLEYGPQGFTPGSGTTVSNITSPYTLTGLTPGTAYTFRIVPICGTIPFEPSARSVNGTTLAQRDTMVPLCEDFAESSRIGSRWLRRSGDSYWEATNDADHYHQAYGSYTTSHSTSYLISPRFADSLHTLSMSFWAKDWYNYSSRTIQIATTHYPNETSEYHYLATVTVLGNAWRYYQVSLDEAPAGDDYIVIRTNASSTFLLMDDIRIAPCLPHDVRVYGVTDHQATIAWEGTESVSVQWGDHTEVGTGGHHTLTGLPADSTFQLLVQGACEGAGCPEVFTVTTLEAPLSTPYCEKFDGIANGQLAQGWVAPFRYDSYPQVRNDNAYSGTRSLQLYSRAYYNYEGYAPRTYVALPLLAEEDLTSLVVSYQAKVLDDYTLSDLGMLDIGVMSDPYDTSTFVSVASHGFSSRNTYASHRISLADYTGTGRYLAFRYRFASDYYRYGRCCIDDVKVSHSYVVSASSATNATDTSVTLQWHTEPVGASVVISYDSVTLTVTGDSSLIVNGLTPGTNYTFRLSTEQCDVADIAHTHRTLDSMLMMPYCEDFQSYANDQNPQFWYRASVHNEYPRIWTGNDGLRYLDMCANQVGANCAYALPIFGESLQGMTLQFSLYHYANTLFIVGVMDDPTDMSTFVPVDTLDFTGRNLQQWYTYTVSLSGYSGTGRHIAFRHETHTTTNSCNWMRDLRIFHCQLTNPRAYNITNNSVTLSWEGYPDSLDGDVWIEYGPRGFAAGSGTSLLATSNPFLVSGLEEDTDYDFLFITSCGGGTCPHPRVQTRTMSFASQPTLCYSFETESDNTMPEGWSVLARYGDYPRVLHLSQYAYQSDAYMDLRAYNCGSTDYRNIIVSPLLQVADMSDLYVTFRYRFNDNNSNVRLVIGVMDDPADTSTFVGVDTILQNRECCQYYTYSGSLASYSGTGRYLAFKYYALSCNSSYMQMDNLVISLCRIANVHTLNTTTHSIDVSWEYPDAGYEGDGVIIEYSSEPFAYGTGTRLTATASPITLDSLEAGQQYYIYVTPQCNSSVDCAIECLTASTKENDFVPPICQDFNFVAEGSFPSDWYRPWLYDGCPQVVSNKMHTAPRSLKIRSHAGAKSYAVMPNLDAASLDGIYLSLWIRCDNNSVMEVGVMENPYDTTTFALIDTLRHTLGNVWKQYSLPLSTYTGSGRYVAFRHSSGSDSYAYVDDVSLRGCQILNPRVHHVSQTSAEVSWYNVGDPLGVWVEYAPVGSSTADFAPGNGTRQFFSGSETGVIHGLTAATYYAFHIWVQCDSTEDECSYAYANAQTLHPFIAFPSCEDFEECANNQNTIMNNWRRLSTFSASSPRVVRENAVSQSNVLRFDARAGSYSVAIMPGMEVTDSCSMVSGKTVRFRAYSRCNPADSGFFEVGVMDDVYDISTFTPVDTVHGTYGSWTSHFVSMENYHGQGSYIAFRYTGQHALGESQFYIDNLCVEPCVAGDIRVSNVEENQVTVTWTSVGHPTVVCEYGPSGFHRGEGTVVSFDSSPGVISGLSASTSYQFYFSSTCACESAGSIQGYTPNSWSSYHWCDSCWCDSCWWTWGWGWNWGWSSWGGGGGSGIGTSVVTRSEPITLPYCDDFEGYDSTYFPRTWYRVHGSNTQYPRVAKNRYHSRRSSMEFYSAPSSDESTRSFAVLPSQGPVDASQMVLKFWAMANNNVATQEDAGFYVGVMSDPMDTSSFEMVARIRMSAANQWEEKVVDFSTYTGTGRYIAFKYAPRGQAYNTYVDDLYLGYCTTSNVQYSNATGNSIDVTWTEHHTPTQVTVTYGEQGFASNGNEGTTVVCTSNPFTITGLNHETSYDFYLNAQCSDGNEACFGHPFTLNPSIVAPYCEDFDGIINGQMPANWSRGQASATNLRVDDGVLRMTPSSGSTSRRFAVLPPLRGDTVGSIVLSFSSKVSNKNYAFLSVGVMADTNNISTYEEIAQVSHTTSNVWQRQVVPLSSYTGTADRIVIMATSSSDIRECYVDDLVVNHFAVPTGIQAHHLSSEQVMLSWSPDPNRTQPYTIEYGRPGFGEGTQVQATGDSVLLSSLRPGTEYEYLFRMGNYEGDCQRFRFSTSEKSALPYCDDFEGVATNGLLPEGWNRYGNCTYYGADKPMPVVTDSYVRYSGSKALQVRFNSSGQYAYAVLPEFDVEQVSDLNFNMMVYCDGYPTRKKLLFGVMEDRDDRNTFVPCDTMLFADSENSQWVLRKASLRSYTGTGRYPAFRYVSDYNGIGLAIDDLKVERFPHPTITAGPDRNVVLNTPGVDSVDYYVEYGQLGFVLGYGTQVHITSNPATIEGLEAGMEYDFYALPSSTGSTCYDPVHLTIQELPRTPLPYCENFDQLTGSYMLPEGWSRISNSSYYPGSYSSYYTSTPYAIRFDASEQMVVLPPLDVDSIKHLSLEMRLCGASYRNNARRFVVGVMDSKTDLSTFVGVDTLWFDTETARADYIYGRMSFHNYQGSGRFIAIKFLCNGSDWLHLDDLIIDRCPAPEVSFYNYNTVKVTSPQPNPDYYIEYGPSSNERDSNQLVHITSSPFYITSLQPNTTYRFWPQGDSVLAQSCYGYKEVTTASHVAIPYCEDFSDYATGTIPEGWNKHGNCTNWYSTAMPTVLNNTLEIRFSASSGQYAMAVLPEFDVDSVNKLDINFTAFCEDEPARKLLVFGVMTNPYDRTTFVSCDTIRFTDSDCRRWVLRKASLHNYHGEGRFPAFCYLSDFSGNGFRLDGFVVDTGNYIPDDLVPKLMDHNTFLLEWDDTTGLADFYIEYGPTGHTQEDGTWIHATQSPVVIDSLQDLLEYQFNFYRDTTQETSCRPYFHYSTSTRMPLPYCENFDSYSDGAIIPGWNRYGNCFNWYNGPMPNICGYRAYTGSKSMEFRFSQSSGQYAYATLPDFDVDSINDLHFRMQLYCDGYSSQKMLILGVMEENHYCSFVGVDTLRFTTDDEWKWVSRTASLENYHGNGRFPAIKYVSNYSGNGVELDNLEVSTCITNATLTPQVVSHNQIRLDIQHSEGSDYWVEYGEEGFTPGTGTLLHHPAPDTLLTLLNNTTYHFYLRCDTTFLPCSTTPTSATTGSAPVAVPSCIDFEDCTSNQLPDGWLSFYDGSYGGSNYADGYVYNNESEAHAGQKSLFLLKRYEGREYVVMPDIAVDSINHAYLSFWAKSTERNGYLEVGVMDHANDIASFVAVKRILFNDGQYHRYGISLNGYEGNGRFVCFRVQSTNSSYYYPMNAIIDDIYLSTCGASDFAVQDISDQSATFSWSQTGQPTLSLEYGPLGFEPGTGTMVHPTQPPYTLEGLSPLTNYTFRITSDCADLGANCSADDSATFNIFTPVGGTGCVDYTDLTDINVSCTYGSYANPYEYSGIVDLGYENILSRHTVHYDTTATDPRTGNLLRVVPPGSDASVRLGNWGTGAEAESITYGLSVDTNDFDLLILKYAAVLQDPAHGASHQPRFRIQILDSAMALIDANCGAADFIANQSLGWNVAANYVLWKDWTTVGLDLSPYAGQRIYVRLTTFDCGESTHYGYAYFTLNCMRKSMQASGCGFVAENTFTAPSGFAYRWYSSANTDSTISTEQSITVASNNDVTYYCDASFVDNASCYFTLSAFAGTRFPLANFTYSYTVENCQFQVQFQNTSTISMDGDTPLGTGEPCETALWDFGNGLTSTSYHGATTYAQPGSYDVTLYSGLAGDACIDSITITITLEDQTVRPLLIGPAEACEGDTVTFSVDHARTFHRWSTGSTSPTISFVADSSLMLRAVVVDSGGCADTLSHTLLVHRLAHVADYCNVCEQDLPYVWQDSLGYSTEQSGNATITFTDAFGCDSIVALHLAIHSSSESYLYDTIVENLLPWDFHSVTLQGDTTDMQLTLTNAAGCDSTLHYNLYVWANQAATADSTLCQNALPLTWNGCTFSHDSSATGSYTLSHQATLATTHGADSLLTMLLHVKVNTHGVVYDSVLENDLPYLFNGQTYTAGGTDTLLLVNADGCDSILVLHLEVHANSSATADSTVCYDALPLTWHGYTFTADTSSYPQTLTHTVVLPIPNAQGADSLLTMNLHVNPVHDVHLHQAICDDASYTFADSAYTATGTYTVAGLANQYGCDSTATLHLTVHPTFDHHTYDTICQGSQRPFGGNQYGSTGDFEHSYLSLHGCDSLSTLHLIVHPITYDTILDTILENQLPYTFNGHLCLDSGAFTITIPNVMGCDSVITYHLFVHRNVTTTLDSAVCDNQLPFLWDDTLFTASSLISTQHLLNVQGADSTVVRRLTVHPTYNQTFAQSVCTDALPFSWQGFAYDADPDTLPYTHQEALSLSLASLHGCDSLVTLTLAVNRTSTSSSTHTDCDSYQWNGTTYLLSGAYDHHLLNALGCDSLASLELTLHYSDTSEESVVSCGEYQWNGQSYSTTGRYEHWTQTAQGCDSLCVLQLRVPVVESERDEEACDRLQWNNHTYTFSGTYTQQFVTSDGCDSIATLHLTIYPSSEEHQQVTLCEADLPYQYNDILFPYGTQRGEQRIEYLDIHGCDSVIRLQLDIFYNPVLSVDMVRYHCYEGEFELQARHSADVDHVVWTSAPYDPTTLGQESDNPLFVSPHQATLYTATAQVPGTDCKNSLSLTVGPIVDLEAALSVTPGFATPAQSEITLRDESHGTVRTWLWLADGDEVGDRPSCAYRYPLEKDSVEIVLIVTEPRFGCHDTATTVVHLLGGDLFAPNAFTPGESTNQRFFVQGKNIIECEISIYARNGQRVYYSVDMAEGWDGRNQAGQPCPEGAYVYLVRYTTTESPRNPITRRGSVLLLR